MKLVLGGIALMVIEVSAFLHSLGSGATLTFIAGAVVFMIGCVKYFLKKPNNTP
jgi:predicted membrane channel-forming protein YqfA (hemolysin III family)